jgi:diguanylate cyclase (GGDEF)-like protein/PAS domain S-box-containing protein
MTQLVLFIAEDPVDAEAVHHAMTVSGNGDFDIAWVSSLSEGLWRLTQPVQSEGPAEDIVAIIVDLSLPDSSGIETFDRLFRAAPHTPILVLHAMEDEDSAELAVERGAADCIARERVDSYFLPKAIRGMIRRKANEEAVLQKRERASATLDSIGDAVLSTDLGGDVVYLNAVAERLTGWTRTEATGRPLDQVLHLIDGNTGEGAPNPLASAVREGKRVSLIANCVLVRRDGMEIGIEDSTAPIHDRHGQVIGAVMVFRDVSQTRASLLRLSHLAQHDSLTGLPNRALFNDRLTRAIAAADRHRHKLALLFLDVDRFKHVNDSLGHPVGDRLLQSLAARLLGCVRGTDTVSRQGGDEFVVLLNEVTGSQDAGLCAEKLMLALSLPHRIDEHDIHVTVSIGIVSFPENGLSVNALMQNADSAMYHAKDSGRNNYQFFMADMNVRAVARQSVEQGIHRAIERQEFVLHYQPQANLQTGAIVASEALVRWCHPERGLVRPLEFISVAEECGSIVPIGRWVLHAACRQAREWQDLGFPSMRIAVNVSAVELRAKGFVAGVRAILMETGLSPQCLELELTETFLMEDSTSTATVLKAVKDMGVRLALDDFGTGYSSLSYLRRFPIDTLKIDRSFVRDLATDADDASIVNAVINMGKSLHMRVVAEGIETAEQLTLLREHDCPEGQGYYFAKPMSASKFSLLLARRKESITGVGAHNTVVAI